ncbi:MAG: hypothetical protein U0903_03380 [Planctomycetales bacterium]
MARPATTVKASSGPLKFAPTRSLHTTAAPSRALEAGTTASAGAFESSSAGALKSAPARALHPFSAAKAPGALHPAGWTTASREADRKQLTRADRQHKISNHDEVLPTFEFHESISSM